MVNPETNIHVLDAAYKPFPTFAEWAAKATVDTIRWDRYMSELISRPAPSSDALKDAYEVVKRAAAVDTGAIEGLYEVDRRFTFTVAFRTAAWELELAKKGEHVRSLFEAQMHAYDYVLDLASQPISTRWKQRTKQNTKSLWISCWPVPLIRSPWCVRVCSVRFPVRSRLQQQSIGCSSPKADIPRIRSTKQVTDSSIFSEKNWQR